MGHYIGDSEAHDRPWNSEITKADLSASLDAMRHRYAERNPKSLALSKEHSNYMPGGNTRTVLHATPFPLVMSHGYSTNLVSVDGHEYVDFLGEYSAGIYGHSCSTIKNAIIKALDKGWNYGAKNEYEGQLAKVLVERFGNGMELIRFCNSGTEANLMALGAAINFTGKRKILAFLHGYHGSSISFPSASPKYTMNPSYEFVLAPYNDIEGTYAAVSSLPPDSLAAVIVEGMQGAGGCIPGKVDFIQHLRKLATDQKALFILDEVMTSRLGYRGLQSRLGISPDITTLGKWPGGGMSFGAFGGRREVMEMFNPGSGKLNHSGTFNNNVITMAAGLAGCEILDEPTVERLNSHGESLRQHINDMIEEQLAKVRTDASTPSKMFATGVGSLFNVTFAGPDKDTLQAIYYHHMLESKIYIATRGYVALNMEITEEHREKFLSAVESFVVQYRNALV